MEVKRQWWKLYVFVGASYNVEEKSEVKINKGTVNLFNLFTIFKEGIWKRNWDGISTNIYRPLSVIKGLVHKFAALYWSKLIFWNTWGQTYTLLHDIYSYASYTLNDFMPLSVDHDAEIREAFFDNSKRKKTFDQNNSWTLWLKSTFSFQIYRKQLIRSLNFNRKKH